jgi:hypothetical protein
MTTLRRLLRYGFWIVAMWLLLAALAWLQLLGPRPSSGREWALLLVGGPVLVVLADLAGMALAREPFGQWLDRRTAEEHFSWRRLLYLLGLFLVVLALGVALISWL